MLSDLASALGRPAETALAGRSLEAVVARVAAGWEVTLWWRSADGTSAGTRVLHDASERCDAVVQTAVASMAVALGADGIDAPTRPPEPPPAPAPVTPAPAPAPTPPTATPAPAPAPSPRRAHMGDVLLGGVLAIRGLPPLSVGFQLVVEPFVYGRFRLGVLATAFTETPLDIPNATVNLAGVEFGVDACTVAWANARGWLQLAGCGGVRAGVVQGFVYAGAIGPAGNRGAFALEASADVRLYPWGPLVVDFNTAIRLSLSRYTLTSTAAGGDVYAQAPLGFELAVRLGVRFP